MFDGFDVLVLRPFVICLALDHDGFNIKINENYIYLTKIQLKLMPTTIDFQFKIGMKTRGG